MENWPIKKNDRERIELPGDWQHYDRHLYKLAQETGFGTVNRLLRHVANELSGIRTPADFYLACAIGRVSPDVAIRSVWPHLGALFVALLLIALIPWISTGFL